MHFFSKVYWMTIIVIIGRKSCSASKAHSLTWADVMFGSSRQQSNSIASRPMHQEYLLPPPPPRKQLSPPSFKQTAMLENNQIQSSHLLLDLDEPIEYPNDFDQNYPDEKFFENDYYEYIDTPLGYTPPPPPPPPPPVVTEEKNNDENSQTADRRTLDFLYHMFVEPARNAKSGQAARPSLIQEVLTTIDKHIVEDLKAWTNPNPATLSNSASYHQHSSPQLPVLPIVQTPSPPILPVNEPPKVYLPAINNHIADVSPNLSGDAFLVTDEVGKQHVVSIDDIVTSLAQLDEQEVTQLLLGGVAGNGIGRVDNTNPASNRALVNVDRPTRHINDVKPQSVPQNNNEIFVMQNENGSLQLVTMQDILTSLKSVEKKRQLEVLKTISSVSILGSNPKASYLSESNSPSNSTGYSNSNLGNGNQNLIKSFSTPLSKTNIKHENEQKPIVKTDEHGNIHIYPDINKPFTLDIQDLLTLSQQPHSSAEIVSTSTTTVKPSDLGNDILDFLIGGVDNLPGPIRAPKLQHTNQNSNSHNSGTSNLSKLLMPQIIPLNQAANNNQQALSALNLISTPQQTFHSLLPNNPQSVHNIFQLPLSHYLPVTTSAPPVSAYQPLTTGLGSTLSNLFSRFIGGDSESGAKSQTDNQSASEVNKPEYVQLVVRKQNRSPKDAIYGHVNIQLPKPIHFQRPQIVQSANSLRLPQAIESNRRSLDLNANIASAYPALVSKPGTAKQVSSVKNVASLVETSQLPQNVQRFLLSQINNQPKFSLPGTRTSRAAQPSVLEEKGSYAHKAPEVQYITSFEPYGPPPSTNFGFSNFNHNSDNPLFDIDFLADIIKVDKTGPENNSYGLPKIGNPQNFVDTNHHHHYY